MTWFNGVQLCLSAAALWLVASRFRALCWRAPLAARLWREAVMAAAGAQQLGLARRLSTACEPAWAARLVAARRTGSTAVEELREDLAHQATRGLHAIAACGRMATPLAFIGVIVEVSEAFSGGSGLVALQRGLAASVGLERALLAFAIGLSTSLVCFTGVALFRAQVEALRVQQGEAMRVLQLLDDAGIESSLLDRKRHEV